MLNLGAFLRGLTLRIQAQLATPSTEGAARQDSGPDSDSPVLSAAEAAPGPVRLRGLSFVSLMILPTFWGLCCGQAWRVWPKTPWGRAILVSYIALPCPPEPSQSSGCQSQCCSGGDLPVAHLEEEITDQALMPAADAPLEGALEPVLDAAHLHAAGVPADGQAPERRAQEEVVLLEF